MNADDSYLLIGGQVVTPGGVLGSACVCVEKGVITGIFSDQMEKCSDADWSVIEVDASHFILPGFIDMHIHGSAGADIMDGTDEALTAIAGSLHKQGVTGFLATTMTESDANISQALRTVANYQPDTLEQAKIVGVHLEGPFLSANKMGAQSARWLRKPDETLFYKWQKQAKGLIKQVTLAPEEDEDFSLIRALNTQGVIASIGHTCCSSAVASKAIQAGASHGTHLFNAMTGVSHRDPGAATAILLNKQVTAELIVDGVHLSPEIIQLTLAMKGAENIVLVTDAMRAQGVGDGSFTLGGQTVHVKGNEARLDNGVLAGSVLSMNKALDNMMRFSGCSLVEASKMASTNPAFKLGLADVGSLEVGKKADITILDANYQVVKTLTT